MSHLVSKMTSSDILFCLTNSQWYKKKKLKSSLIGCCVAAFLMWFEVMTLKILVKLI